MVKQLPILETLRIHGFITTSLESMLRSYIESWGVSEYDACIETHALEELGLSDAIAQIYKLERVKELRYKSIPLSVVTQIPFPLAYQHTCVMISDEKSEGCLAIPAPEIHVQKKMENLLRKKIRYTIGEPSDIREAILRLYPWEEQLGQ